MIVFLILFFNLFFMNITFAEEGISAYNIEITSKYVLSTGVCSCSLCTDRYHHTRIFYNLNPATGKHNVLYFEEGPASWTSPEGLWVARDTDMDFCLVHGKSHDNRGIYLIPYNGVINGYIVQNGYLTGERTVQNTIHIEKPVEYVNVHFKGKEYKIEKNKIDDLKNKIKKNLVDSGIQRIIIIHPLS